MIRVLGKGKTAQAIKESLGDKVVLFDDLDKDIFDKNSNELTIVSPGIPPHNQLVKSSKNLISEYDFFIPQTKALNIWISGTNGKTTTTSMTELLLKQKGAVAGGNIGTPLAKLDKDANIWILETSSFTLHYTKKSAPNIYILLPITKDHISWHGSYEDYKKSKLSPLDNMSEGSIAIIPAEFKEYKTKAKKVTYNNSSDLAKYFDIDINRLNFKEPFLLDAILALCSTKILFDEIDYNLINSFVIAEHKLEEFRDKSNRIWVNDSKATNIDATIWAVKAYKDKEILLILGGDDKGVELKPLFEELKNYKITIFSIGKNSKKLINLANEYNIVAKECKFLKNAINFINEQYIDANAQIAVLSPAAASLDQYSSYAKRGEEFKNLAKNLQIKSN